MIKKNHNMSVYKSFILLLGLFIALNLGVLVFDFIGTRFVIPSFERKAYAREVEYMFDDPYLGTVVYKGYITQDHSKKDWVSLKKNEKPIFVKITSKGEVCEINFDEYGYYLSVYSGDCKQKIYEEPILNIPATICTILEEEKGELFRRTCFPYLFGLPRPGIDIINRIFHVF